jgi:hypothetical protein
VGLPRFDIFQTLTCVFPCIDTHFAMILLCNWRLISKEPQVTEPELLQENKNDIVGNKILHCGKLMDMFNKFYKEHGQNEPRCMALHEGTGMPADKNNARRPSTPSGELWRPT